MSVRPPHVVLPIGEHVEEQTDGYCPAPPRQVTVTPIGQAAHEGVEHNGGIGMEGMKRPMLMRWGEKTGVANRWSRSTSMVANIMR